MPVDDQCIEVYNDLKLKKNYQYILYKLSDDNKLVVVEKTAPAGKGGDAEAEYKAFIASLPQDDCRYAVYDFHFTINEGERNKILFYAWWESRSGADEAVRREDRPRRRSEPACPQGHEPLKARPCLLDRRSITRAEEVS